MDTTSPLEKNAEKKVILVQAYDSLDETVVKFMLCLISCLCQALKREMNTAQESRSRVWQV